MHRSTVETAILIEKQEEWKPETLSVYSSAFHCSAVRPLSARVPLPLFCAMVVRFPGGAVKHAFMQPKP